MGTYAICHHAKNANDNPYKINGIIYIHKLNASIKNQTLQDLKVHMKKVKTNSNVARITKEHGKLAKLVKERASHCWCNS